MAKMGKAILKPGDTLHRGKGTDREKGAGGKSKQCLKFHSAPSSSGQMVSFDQRDAGRAADPRNDRGIVPGRQVGQQSRFCIVPGSETGRLNDALLRVFPIVVSADSGPLSIN